MTATSGPASVPGTFVTVPGDRHSEVARNLAEPVPQALGLLDQLGLWGNLGVSLLGFTGAIFVLRPNGHGTPELSLLPWAAGFVTYQLINPGYVSWWVSAWTRAASAIGFTPASWMSASILSFVVAAAVTLAIGGLAAVTRRRNGATAALSPAGAA